MDFRKCANCNSKSFENRNSQCKSKEDHSELGKLVISTAFENALQFQNVNPELPDGLKLCHICSEPLNLFCSSRKFFLKLSSPDSKLSRMLTREIYAIKESSQSSGERSEKQNIKKLPEHYKNSDSTTEPILPDQGNTCCTKISQHQDLKPFHSSADEVVTPRTIKSEREHFIADAQLKNEEAILPDHEDNLDWEFISGCIKKDVIKQEIIEYQEKIIKIELEKLSEEIIAMFSINQNCVTNESDETAKEKSNFHECSDCSRIFLESEKLENHKSLAHTISQSNSSCSFCSKSFSIAWFHKNHLNACHNGIEVLHYCQICCKKFYGEKQLEDHKLEVHDVRKHPYKCRNCVESFEGIDELRTHLIDNHKGTREADAAEMNLKAKAEKKLRMKQCSVCKEVFQDLVSVRKHRDSVHGTENSFDCIMCPEKFHSRPKLFKHRQIHKSCIKCQKNFKDYNKLMHHYDRMHGDHLPCICEMCGQRYPEYGRLQAHYRWHVEVHGPKHICYICNRSFKLKSHLMMHMRQTHSEKNKKKHDCPFCDLVFTGKGNLYMHLRGKHEDRMEFPCKICGKKFLTVDSLSSHTRVHTQATAFEAVEKTERCKSVLQTMKSLAHEKIEVMACYSSETFLFTCPVCGKSCDSQTHFFRHLRMVHSLIGYADSKAKVSSIINCSVCNKNFKRKDLLDKHRRRAHNITNKSLAAPVVSRSYECPHCKKIVSASFFQTFMGHVTRHEIFIVDSTKGKETTKKELAEYYNEENKKFTCTVCKQTFVKQSQFIYHIQGKIHSKLKIIIDKEKKSLVKFPFECKQCPGRTYPSLQLLQKHREGHRFRKDRMRTCNICDATLRSEKYLQMHMKTEHHDSDSDE